MTYPKLLQTLTQQQYAPVYFLQGTESYYINTIVDHVENHIIPPNTKSFDLTTLYGQDVTLQQVIKHAKRFPMMASHHLVIVKEAQGLQDLHKETAQKHLLQYLEKPNTQTILLFAYKNKTLDQRKSFTKKLAQKAVLFNAQKVYERELPAWIEDYVQTHGYHINPEATHMLVTLIGENLQILANELNKITIHLTQGDTITLPLIRQHVSQSKNFDIFDLQQAFQTHNTQRIWDVTQYFIQNPKKYPLLPQITLLTNFFAKLLLLHQKPYATTSQIATHLRIPPYFAKNYQQALTHYTQQKTTQNLHHLHQADLQIKGIQYPTTPETTILKTLVAKLLISP